MRIFQFLVVTALVLVSCGDNMGNNTSGSAELQDGSMWTVNGGGFTDQSDLTVHIILRSTDEFDYGQEVHFNHVPLITDTIRLQYVSPISDDLSSYILTRIEDVASESFELYQNIQPSSWLLFNKIDNKKLQGEFQAVYVLEEAWNFPERSHFPFDTVIMIEGKFNVQRF
ncbi:MAG: hypothetical protein DRI69_05140 [Bacteroidetes bacterium]|nr:MAG: hypothetical protein DRI69_05140 [Bacteroidota bacterium]